jgi:LssY C-terminus
MRRRFFSRRTAYGLVAAFLVYGIAAYLLAPEYWWLRERGHVTLPDAMVTSTIDGIAGDPINVGFIGTKAELIHAFTVGGWHPADAITWRTSLEIGESVIFDRPYADAPVSTLMFERRKQDLAFEKPVGESADRRHHVRIWQMPDDDDGEPLWLCSASFDRGVGLSHDTGQITHHIGPDIDAERDFLIGDLNTPACSPRTTRRPASARPRPGATAAAIPISPMAW